MLIWLTVTSVSLAYIDPNPISSVILYCHRIVRYGSLMHHLAFFVE